jgi:hypothetical protein
MQELSVAAQEAIGAIEPDLAITIMRAIGKQLSGKVSDMSRTVIALGG